MFLMQCCKNSKKDALISFSIAAVARRNLVAAWVDYKVHSSSCLNTLLQLQLATQKYRTQKVQDCNVILRADAHHPQQRGRAHV